MNELAIVQYFNSLGSGSVLDFITTFVSFIPFLIILWLFLGIVAVLFDKKDGWVIFTTAVIAIALHFLISEGVLKHAILTFFPMRTRPYLAHPGEIILVAKQSIGSLTLTKNFIDSSFPSSHMASSLAVLTVFVYFYRKTWPLAVAFVLFMMYSRMHLGMHYPTDVLAGTALGIGYGALAIFITKKIFKKKKKVSGKKSKVK
jgi:undecaprenyl-diphosphatase